MGLYDAVLLDLDGTLLDYDAAQRHAVSRLLELPGVPGDAFEVLLGIARGDALQDLEACRRGEDDAMRRFGRELSEAGIAVTPGELFSAYLDALGEHGEPLPGAAEVMADLHREHSVGIVSNGRGDAQRRRLQAAGLMEHLDLLVLSCEVGIAKPSPGILELAMRLAGSEPSRTLFVGDSARSDMGAAAAAGVDFAWLRLDGEFAGDGPRRFELRSLRELPGLLSQVDRGPGGA